MAGDAEVEKKIRTVRKKLQQIARLKEKGADLDDEAKKKVASEPELLAELAELEASLPASAPKPAAQEETPPAPKTAKPKAKSKAADAPPATAAAAAKSAAAAPAATAPAAASAPAKAAPAESSREEAGPNAEQEKQIRSIKKKLGQIAKLKEKGGSLDADAQEKINTEPRLLRELAALERGEEIPQEECSPPAKAKATPSAAPAQAAAAEPAGPALEDPHAEARAAALQPAPGDLGLLLDDEVEKRFKTLQKKLRDIGKLREKDKLDKLQVEKLTAEPGLIEELTAIRAQAAAKIAERRSNAAAARQGAADKKAAMAGAPRGAPPGKPGVAWECPNCGASGQPSDLEGDSCPKCGFDSLMHFKPGRDQAEEEDEDDEADDTAAAAKKKFDSPDLKTARQKKAAQASSKQDTSVQASASSAKWPEVKDVLESGDGGVDKSRQKKAICVDHPKPEPPYNEFDQVLLKCSFLTQVELKLSPEVIGSEAFQLYFPGMLSEGLLELILKENSLTAVPAGVSELKRIRSLDLSHNKITALPIVATWESIAGSLELLDLSFNQLDSIQELAPLTKLSSLKVDANKLTSLEGVSWSKLKQLVSLTGVANQIAEIPEEIEERAESLEIIDLSENKITAVPTAFKELKKLKSLSLSGNPIKDQKVVKAAEKGIKDLKAYLSKVPKGKK